MTLRAVGVGLVLVLVAGCGQASAGIADLGPDGPLLCPNDLPQSCPAPAPSWSGVVAPIVANQCALCHQPGGTASSKPLTSYQEVYARRVTVLTEVYGCQMPPAPDSPLDDAERASLLGWLVCGAPNN